MVSRKIVNLFENFVWVLEKYFEHVCLLIFEFFEISMWVVWWFLCDFFFHTERIALHRYGESNMV